MRLPSNFDTVDGAVMRCAFVVVVAKAVVVAVEPYTAEQLAVVFAVAGTKFVIVLAQEEVA